MHTRHIFLVLILAFFSVNAFSVTYNSTGNGQWGAPGTWSPAGPPGCGDTIYILAGHTVTIENQQDYSEPGCTSPMFVIIDGTLDFPVNGPKLRLPCNSGVILNAGGQLTASGAGGGGAANFLEICGSVVWQKSDGTQTGPMIFGNPLPIVLISFTAEIDNTSVKLEWQTESELNNDYFTIERSTNGLDFEVLGEVPGSGNSNVLRSYDYFDDNPVTGTSYYRLKQTDFDGKYEYSGLIAVNFDKDDDGICTLKVYPNPCVGTCTIQLEDCPLADNQVDVELYDAFGKKITNRISAKDRGQDINFNLDASNNLAPGVYIVKSSANGKQKSSKVIVK